MSESKKLIIKSKNMSFYIVKNDFDYYYLLKYKKECCKITHDSLECCKNPFEFLQLQLNFLKEDYKKKGLVE